MNAFDVLKASCCVLAVVLHRFLNPFFAKDIHWPNRKVYHELAIELCPQGPSETTSSSLGKMH